ncbi:MAG: nitrate reductase [Bifidobacteriaceae bacterium]|jgi:uracil-xanthine permease|nr:nitrate reductase [Bifidobacteriaceae bacterium]
MFKYKKVKFSVKTGDGGVTVVSPEERLGWGKTIALGLQHIVAMFGATFLVPLLIGFPPATTLFFTSISTALFLLICAGKVPSYLGSSFALIAPVTATVSSSGGQGSAIFGILCTGLLLALVGVIVHWAGVKWINILMPPVVCGSIVALIGFNLAPSAWSNFDKAPITAFITLVFIIFFGAVFRRGKLAIISRLSILLGVIVGYIYAVSAGQVEFSKINDAKWFGLPEFSAPTVNFGVLLMFLPAVFVLIAENIGHIKSISTMTGKNLDKYSGRALLADGLGTVLAGLGGGSATTTYAENIGVMAATKVYSTAVYWVAAVGTMILALCPKFGIIISTVPAGVLGGAATLLYGMIGMLGVRIWMENKVNFARMENITVAAVTLVIGIADFTFTIGDITVGGIAIGSLVCIALFHILKVFYGFNKDFDKLGITQGQESYEAYDTYGV